ncbi:MAG TPA: SEC-C metal-binding domain-containing protein [Planctomycetaceae bacterium]|nr:SEC-C metal-binding domain-containing protein [Planctomycetaceae bacterium]
MSKRRKGFPSETYVKRGVRIVHGEKLLEEKLGRHDLCPCGSGRRFRKCCLRRGRFRRCEPQALLSGTDEKRPARARAPGGSPGLSERRRATA